MQVHQKMRADIARQGFTIMAVPPSPQQQGFAYTIGLSETLGCPEILVFGLPMQVAYVILNDFARLLQAGTRFNDGDVVNEILTLPVAMRAITHEKAAEYTIQLFNMYPQNAVPPAVMQMVRPDTRGRFPWIADFDRSLETMQPSLWSTLH